MTSSADLSFGFDPSVFEDGEQDVDAPYDFGFPVFPQEGAECPDVCCVPPPPLPPVPFSPSIVKPFPSTPEQKKRKAESVPVEGLAKKKPCEVVTDDDDNKAIRAPGSKHFPKGASKSASKPKTEAEDAKPKAKPAEDANPKAKPAEDAKPKAKPADDAKPKAKLADDAKPKAKLADDAKPKSKPAEDAKPKAKPADDAKPKAKPADDAKPKAKPNPIEDAKPKAKPADDAKPKSKPAENAKPKSKPAENAKPKSKPVPEEKPVEPVRRLKEPSHAPLPLKFVRDVDVLSVSPPNEEADSGGEAIEASPVPSRPAAPRKHRASRAIGSSGAPRVSKARPHKRLSKTVLLVRLNKLEERAGRYTRQLATAAAHLESYVRERVLRIEEGCFSSDVEEGGEACNPTDAEGPEGAPVVAKDADPIEEFSSGESAESAESAESSASDSDSPPPVAAPAHAPHGSRASFRGGRGGGFARKH